MNIYPSAAELKVMIAIKACNRPVYGLEIVRSNPEFEGIERNNVHILLKRLLKKQMIYITHTTHEHAGAARPHYDLTSVGHRMIEIAKELL